MGQTYPLTSTAAHAHIDRTWSLLTFLQQTHTKYTAKYTAKSIIGLYPTNFPPFISFKNSQGSLQPHRTTSHPSPDVSILKLFSPNLQKNSLASSGAPEIRAKFFGSGSVSRIPEAWKPSLMSSEEFTTSGGCRVTTYFLFPFER